MYKERQNYGSGTYGNNRQQEDARGYYISHTNYHPAQYQHSFLVATASQNQTKVDQANKDKRSLSGKIDALNKKLATSGSASLAPTCSSTISDATKTKIRDAIASKDYASLTASMAAPINVSVAASGKTGGETPDQAVTDLAYLSDGTAPWDFALSAATITSYRSGSYAPYFGSNTYVGKSANNYVVSFDFNACGQISTIFMTNNAALLL